MFNKKAKKAPAHRKASFFKLKLTLAIICGLLSVSITAVTVWAFNITNSDLNLPNVYVNGVFVGSMTEAQTVEKLEELGWKEESDKPMVVKLPADVSFEVDVVKSGVMFSVEEAAQFAHDYGHGSNVYGNLSKYLKNKFSPVDISDIYGGINYDYIRAEVEKGIALFNEKTADKGYELDEENAVLRLMKGAGQMEIKADRLTEQLTHMMITGERVLEKNSIDNTLTMPDFQKLYDEVCVEAKDAEYTEKFEVIEQVVGRTFDIAQAQENWDTAKPTEYYEIPLNLVEPEISSEELLSRLFRDRLGSQTTLYTYSSDNRINNIKLSASKFDGMILYPGDTFSFNEVVGKRTEEAGFLSAGAYLDGEVVQEIGGGICQVSSTLYCASMYAQMKTVYRESHYFKVDYLPLAYDATVSWSKPDFKFRNDREYPVKLVVYTDDEAKSITVEIWGTDTDGSYVELTNWQEPIYDKEYTDVVIGTNALATRMVYDKDGKLIKKVQEPYSVYHLHADEIQWPEDAMEKDEDDEDNPDILSGILGALDQQNNGAIIIS